MAIPTTNLVVDLDARDAGSFTLYGDDKVQTWNDVSGAGNHFSQLTQTSAPKKVTDRDGNPCVEFRYYEANVAANDSMDATGPATVNTRNISIYFVCEMLAQTYNQIALSSVATLLAGFYGPDDISTPPRLRMQDKWATDYTTNPLITPRCNKTVYSWVGRAASSEFATNLAHGGVAAAPVNLTTTGLTLGKWNNPTSYCWMRLYRVAIYAAQHSAAEMDTVINALISDHSVRTSFDGQIVFAGDSIVHGVGGDGLINVATEFLGHSDGRYKIQNLALPATYFGAVGDAVPDNHANTLDPILDTNVARNVAIWMGSINAFTLGGQTAAQQFTRLQTYGAARVSAGWEFIPMTIIDAGSNDTPVRDYNDLIRGGDSSYSVYADFGAGSSPANEFSATNADANRTYYADSNHPTALGHELMGQYAWDDLTTLWFASAATPTSRKPVRIGGVMRFL